VADLWGPSVSERDRKAKTPVDWAAGFCGLLGSVGPAVRLGKEREEDGPSLKPKLC
jgi:hypothetical protein